MRQVQVVCALIAFTCGAHAASAQDSLSASTTYLTLRYARATGELSLLMRDSAGQQRERSRVRGVTLDGGSFQRDVAFEVLGPRAIAVTWSATDQNEHDWDLALTDEGSVYYGTGERFNALNQRGYMLPMVSDDRYGPKGVGTYKPVAFFMSERGFGVWLDSYGARSFDLKASDRYTAHLRSVDKRLRVVFLAGPAYTDILQAFTALTGRTRVPPAWAFGLWKSRDVHHNQDSVYADIERLRRYGIPASVLLLDSPWETGYNNFEVNRTQFANADTMFARIRRLGFELCFWLTPFVNDSAVTDMTGVAVTSSNYDAAVRAGVLVKDSNGNVASSHWWKGRGAAVDFTDPQAIAWWHEQLRKTRAYGARAFKVDDGEGHFVAGAVFKDGSTARLMKNRYSVLYDSVMQAFVDKELHGNGVLSVRSGYTGMQRFPFAWAGDNHASFSFDDGLPSVILAGQNAAMSGLALWGSDIAGYAGRPDKELFIRWSQFGAFTPLMQVHMTSNLGPWDFDEETLQIFRTFARLHTRLFPYLYNAVHEAARTGIPIIRPMALAFQEDATASAQIYQYMFGPDLLVAPMYQPGTQRSVYLPAGQWVDYWTHQLHTGPRMLDVTAPLARVPLFVRAGAILPLLSDSVQTLVQRNPDMSKDVVTIDDKLVLEVWPGSRGALQTWDGLQAALTSSAARSSLRITTTRARPLELRLISRKLPKLLLPGARVRVVGDETRIAWTSFRGDQRLEW